MGKAFDAMLKDARERLSRESEFERNGHLIDIGKLTWCPKCGTHRLASPAALTWRSDGLLQPECPPCLTQVTLESMLSNEIRKKAVVLARTIALAGALRNGTLAHEPAKDTA